MTPEDIRIKALELALEHASSPEEHVQVARQFEQYIVGSTPTPLEPCITCGHTVQLHLYPNGCTHPDGCECGWPSGGFTGVHAGPPAPETASAPTPEKCVGCTRGVHPHAFTKCPDCECMESAE